MLRKYIIISLFSLLIQATLVEPGFAGSKMKKRCQRMERVKAVTRELLFSENPPSSSREAAAFPSFHTLYRVKPEKIKKAPGTFAAWNSNAVINTHPVG